MNSKPIPPELRAATKWLRTVRAEKPKDGPHTEEYAAWRERMADSLESMSQVLLFPEDRRSAFDEANAARAEAARIREDLGDTE